MPTTRPGRWVKPEARSLLGGRRPGSPRFPERAREQGAATPASPLGVGGDGERRDDAARAWPRLGSRTLAFVAACVVLAAVALALARFAPGGLAVSLPTWDADASADASREKTPSTEARERPSRDVPSRLSAEEDPAPTAPRAWTIAPRGLAMREGPMAKREAHRSERLHARAVVPAELDPPEARVGSGDRRMSGKRSGNHRRETAADVDAKAKAKAKEASRATVAVAAEREKLSASRRAFERTSPSRSLDAKPRATSRDAAPNPPPRAPEGGTVPPKRVEKERRPSSRKDRPPRGAPSGGSKRLRSAPDAHHHSREGDGDHHRRVASRERTRTRTRVVAERVHEGGSPAGRERLRAATRTRTAPKEEERNAQGRRTPFVLAELGASLASAEATAELSRRGEASGRDLGAALVADIAASATAAAIASRREALLAGDPLDGGGRKGAFSSADADADADAAREARAAARARRAEVPREAALGAEDRAGEAGAFGLDDADAFLVRAATNPEAMV